MNIVFLCKSNNRTPFSEFIPLIKFLKKKNLNSFLLLEDTIDSNTLEIIRNEKIDYYINDKKNFYFKKSTIYKNSKTKSFIKKKIKKFLPLIIVKIIKQFINFFYFYKYFSKTDRLIDKIFDIEKPNALILYHDRAMDLTPSAIKRMKNDNKPVIDIQIAVPNNNFLYLNSRKHNFDYSTKNPINYIFGLFFSKHKQCFGKESVLFYPWYQMLALFLKKMLPPNPWFIGQNNSDKFLMISKKDEKIITGNNAKLSKNIVVGQYSHDFLHDAFKNKDKIKSELLKKYFNLDQSDNEIIILSMPQFFEHHIFDKEKSFEEINYILEILSKFDDKLIFLSLHPKMLYKNYSFIDKKFKNVKIIKDERLSRILPTGDYFLSMFESTTTWALMCNILPIFLDYYKIYLDSYNKKFDTPGYYVIQILQNKKTFKEDMQRIFNNKNFLTKRISTDKNYLPPFDGKTGERIYHEILNAILKK